jgi:hypothetical protein
MVTTEVTWTSSDRAWTSLAEVETFFWLTQTSPAKDQTSSDKEVWLKQVNLD